MGYKWVEDYPEARSKYNQYKSIVDSLTYYLADIDTAYNVYISTIASLEDSTGVLESKYYDEYCNAVSEWWNKADQFQVDFGNAKTALAIRISNAKGLRDMWSGRIGVGHNEYEED